jgi:hypothetical protein
LQICQVAHGHLCRRVTGEEKKQPEAVTPVGVLYTYIYVIRGLTLGMAWGAWAWPCGREKRVGRAGGRPRMISHRPNMLHDVNYMNYCILDFRDGEDVSHSTKVASNHYVLTWLEV